MSLIFPKLYRKGVKREVIWIFGIPDGTSNDDITDKWKWLKLGCSKQLVKFNDKISAIENNRF